LLNLFSLLAALEPPTRDNQLTPPGNLTLVDDLSGIQTLDKQFITVTTRNGNYFYIIIDRAGERDNVHFLNLVDEYALLQILQGEDFVEPPLPDFITPTVPTTDEPAEPEDEPTATPRRNSNTGLLLGLLVIAAVGGGAFYYFKVLKPKQGANKKGAVKSELDEFDFDESEDDLFSDRTDTDEPEFEEYEDTTDDNRDSYDKSEADEEIPDFTATPDSDDFTFNDFNDESEDK